MILTREIKEKLAKHYAVPEFNEYGLQIFAEAVQGKKLVYLYRIASKAATVDGATLAFTTENGRTKSKDADSTATKDGSIRTPGTSETEITATSILAKGDKLIDELEEAMDDDLNTADAISAIFELVTAINQAVKDGASKEFAQKSLDTLLELTHVLGLLEAEEDADVDDEIKKLVDEREAARAAKDFAKADQIRDELKAKGITLKDTPQGVQIIKEEV